MSQAISSVAVVPPRPRRRLSGVRLRDFILLPIIGLAVVAGALASPAFLTIDNILNILQQSSELSILVLAESLILIGGKFDLSLESTVGFAPMLGAWLVAKNTGEGGSGLDIGAFGAIAVVFAAGALIGLANGLLVVKLRLNAFITTLAMLILLRGTTVGMSNGQTLFDLPPSFTYLGSAQWAGVPASIWIAALMFAAFIAIMRFHRLGRAVYALGGNAEAARIAGIPVERLTVGLFVMGGLLAALAGLMLSGRIASVVTSQGQNMIFYVFAAAVIGGINLNGGEGRLLGALLGVILLGVLQNMLTLSQIAAFWIDAAYGAIILVSLIIARLGGQTTRS
ncbi:MAG: ABC transporter permease [Gluconacetobacter diazotrophicus]|nr:ABC transporter permease [Gluconacetobacter diazotrophicus]